MINSYAKLCNACAKGGDFASIGQMAAQLQAQLGVTRPANGTCAYSGINLASLALGISNTSNGV
jgi:hypothetical protein